MGLGANLRIVANAAQQAIGDARRSPAAAGDFLRRAGSSIDTSSSLAERCTMLADPTLIGIKPQHQAETGAQWSADQALPSGGADRR